MEKAMTTEKEIDASEVAKALVKLPEEERMKIFYMIKGIELVNETAESKAS